MGKFSIEIKWAVIFTAASIAWMIVEKSVGLHDVQIGKQPAYTNLFGIIAILVFILAIREKKRAFYAKNMSWRQGFISGIYLSFFIAVLSPFAQFIIYNYVTPEFTNNMVQYMVSHNEMPRERAEAIFNMRSYILQAVSGSLSMGVLTSALVALFLKTKKSAN